MEESENIRRSGTTDVNLNMKELVHQNNNDHFGSIRFLPYKKSQESSNYILLRKISQLIKIEKAY